MQKLKAGTIKRIHVNKQLLARARRERTTLPAITIQTSTRPIPATLVLIHGPSKVVQACAGRKQLRSGARVWIETRAEVEYYDESGSNYHSGVPEVRTNT